MQELQEIAQATERQLGEPPQKRRKLKAYDLMPAQTLNAMGESGIGNASLAKVAEAMAAGNKAALFFSELCDESDVKEKRKGVAVSRLAEVMLKVGRKLKEPLYKKYLQSDLHTKAMTEFTKLEPAFTELMGKGITMDDDAALTVGKIAYGSGSAESKDPAKVDAAAKDVYDWLRKEDSKFRQLMAFLSASGLFYVGSVHEKSHRAYIHHGYKVDNVKKVVGHVEYQTWAKARLCSADPKASGDTGLGCDDLKGL